MRISVTGPSLLVASLAVASASPGQVGDPSRLKDKVTIGVGKKLLVRFDRTGNALSGPRVVEQAAAACLSKKGRSIRLANLRQEE
jgi:hypothetical protein